MFVESRNCERSVAETSIAFMREKLEKGEPVKKTAHDLMAVINGWWYRDYLPRSQQWIPTHLTVELLDNGLLPPGLVDFAEWRKWCLNAHLQEELGQSSGPASAGQ